MASPITPEAWDGIKVTITNMSTFEGNAALLAGDLDAQVRVPLVETGKVRFICSTHGDRRLGRLNASWFGGQ